MGLNRGCSTALVYPSAFPKRPLPFDCRRLDLMRSAISQIGIHKHQGYVYPSHLCIRNHGVTSIAQKRFRRYRACRQSADACRGEVRYTQVNLVYAKGEVVHTEAPRVYANGGVAYT